MSRRLISRLADLPAEFHIEKYRVPPSAGLWYWVAMLEARVLRHFMLSGGDFYREEIQHGAIYMLNDPQWPARIWPKEQGTGLRKEVSSSHVSDVDLYRHFSAQFDLEDLRLQDFSDAWKQLQETDSYNKLPEALKILRTPVWQAYRDVGLSLDGDVEVHVNLCGSEEKIIDDFRAWLRRTKAAFGIELPRRRVQQSDLDTWEKYQILAYLDLSLWAKAWGLEITHNLMGLALFPSEYEVSLSERIRKVVVPLALGTATENFTDMLRAQALETEPNSADSVPDKWGTMFMTEEGRVCFTPESK